MNLKEKKATVILYDVKLAEEMPQTISNIVLSNLDLGFSSSGIYVSGSNVVPSVYEGGAHRIQNNIRQLPMRHDR